MLLGIGHKARQGKDEVGRYLEEKYGFKIFHFADALKEEALVYGWSPDDKNAEATKIFKNMSKRQKDEFTRKPYKHDTTSFLQWLGTYRRETVCESYWIDKLLDKILHPQLIQNLPRKHRYDNIAICDMRYVNELVAVKRNDGYTIDVQRYEDYYVAPSSHDHENEYGYDSIGLPTRYIDTTRDSTHPSEIELDCIPHDITIINNSSIEALHTHVDAVIRYLTLTGA